MTILQVLIIAQIGSVIIAGMNGRFPYLREQEDINVQNATNNCFKQLTTCITNFSKGKS